MEPQLVDAAMIADMRLQLEGLMPQLCDITRTVNTKVKGSHTKSVVTVATGVQCRLMPGRQSGRERGDDDQRTESAGYDVSHILTVPHGTALQRGDFVAVTGEATRYTVVELRLDDSAYKTCLRAGVKTVEG